MPRGVYARKDKPSPPAPQETPPVPDLKTQEAADNITRDAYAAGRYELRPQIKPAAAPDGAPGADEPNAATLETPREPDAPGEPPTPPHLIRMTHPDNGSADGFERDETGATLVPWRDVETMKGHGFVVDHLPARRAAE